MRKRDQQFAEAFVFEVGAAGGVVTDEVMLRAGRAVWERPVTEPKLLAKVRKKLKQPDVREAIADVYSAAGFDVVEAVRLHIDHIRGNTRGSLNSPS